MGEHSHPVRSLTGKILAGLLAASLMAGLVAGVNTTPASAAGGVTCNIVTGGERPSQQIARLYKAVFHRPPEPSGWNYWKGVYETQSLFEIAGYFVQATEFTNLYGSATNAEFVDLIYRNVMGRESEPSGYDYWLGVLNRGEVTRAGMVVYFSESTEFKRRENELYFEQCPILAPTNPSVAAAQLYNFETDDNPGLWYRGYEWAMAHDGATGSSAHAFTQNSAFGDSYIGRRTSGQSCVTWRVVDEFTAESVASSAGFFFSTDVFVDYSELRFLTQGGNLEYLVDGLGPSVDAEAPYHPVDSCDPEAPLITASAAKRFAGAT